MDAVTYPDSEVERFVRDHLTPARINTQRPSEATRRYRPLWTPTFLVLDDEGAAQLRLTGYLPPDDFRGEIGVGLALAYLARGEYDNAYFHLRDVAGAHPATDAGAAAQYWAGVARYRAQGDWEACVTEWKTLLERWPRSRWARSAGFIRG